MGLQKVMSTRSSPLIVIATFYGILAIMYALPPANNSLNLNKVLSTCYTIVILMVNPLT